MGLAWSPVGRFGDKPTLSDSEVEAKFRSLACELLAPAQTDALLDRLWRLEEVAEIGQVIQMTRV